MIAVIMQKSAEIRFDETFIHRPDLPLSRILNVKQNLFVWVSV